MKVKELIDKLASMNSPDLEVVITHEWYERTDDGGSCAGTDQMTIDDVYNLDSRIEIAAS